MDKIDKYFRRIQFREEYMNHILTASGNFKSKKFPRLKLSKKEKLFLLSRIVMDKALSNLTGE